jgi:CHAD domain-containing protein
MSYRFHGHEKVSDGIVRIAAEQFERIRTLRRGHIAGGERVHEIRKAIKKLRALLRLVRKNLPEHFFQRGNRSLRETGRALAPLRDAHVLAHTAGRLSRRFGRQAPTQFAAARKLMAAEGDRVTAGSREALARAEGRLKKSRAHLAKWPVGNIGWEDAACGLAGSYRAARKAFATAQRDRRPGRLHEWRKRAKDFCYHLRLLCELWPPLMHELARQVDDLTDFLGDDHDLTALSMALGIGSDSNFKAVERIIGAQQKKLQKCAVALGGNIFAERPREFAHRMRGYAKTLKDRNA